MSAFFNYVLFYFSSDIGASRFIESFGFSGNRFDVFDSSVY
jgi:hypothetical protein